MAKKDIDLKPTQGMKKATQQGQLVFTNRPELIYTKEELEEKIADIIEDQSEDTKERISFDDLYQTAKEYVYETIQNDNENSIKHFLEDLGENQKLRAKYRTNDTNLQLLSISFFYNKKFEPVILERYIKSLNRLLEKSLDDGQKAEFEGYIYANRLVIYIVGPNDIEVVLEIFKVADNGRIIKWSDN